MILLDMNEKIAVRKNNIEFLPINSISIPLFHIKTKLTIKTINFSQNSSLQNAQHIPSKLHYIHLTYCVYSILKGGDSLGVENENKKNIFHLSERSIVLPVATVWEKWSCELKEWSKKVFCFTIYNIDLVEEDKENNKDGNKILSLLLLFLGLKILKLKFSNLFSVEKYFWWRKNFEN